MRAQESGQSCRKKFRISSRWYLMWRPWRLPWWNSKWVVNLHLGYADSVFVSFAARFHLWFPDWPEENAPWQAVENSDRVCLQGSQRAQWGESAGFGYWRPRCWRSLFQKGLEKHHRICLRTTHRYATSVIFEKYRVLKFVSPFSVDRQWGNSHQVFGRIKSILHFDSARFWVEETASVGYQRSDQRK